MRPLAGLAVAGLLLLAMPANAGAVAEEVGPSPGPGRLEVLDPKTPEEVAEPGEAPLLVLVSVQATGHCPDDDCRPTRVLSSVVGDGLDAPMERVVADAVWIQARFQDQTNRAWGAQQDLSNHKDAAVHDGAMVLAEMISAANSIIAMELGCIGCCLTCPFLVFIEAAIGGKETGEHVVIAAVARTLEDPAGDGPAAAEEAVGTLVGSARDRQSELEVWVVQILASSSGIPLGSAADLPADAQRWVGRVIPYVIVNTTAHLAGAITAGFHFAARCAAHAMATLNIVISMEVPPTPFRATVLLAYLVQGVILAREAGASLADAAAGQPPQAVRSSVRPVAAGALADGAAYGSGLSERTFLLVDDVHDEIRSVGHAFWSCLER